MGCTPQAHAAKEVPSVNAQPSRIQLKSITSIQDIMKHENSSVKLDINDLDIKMGEECQKRIIVAKMDFQNKEVIQK